MESVDWSVKPDQIEGFVLRDIAVSFMSFCVRAPEVSADGAPSFVEQCTHPRAVLRWCKGGGRVDQRRPGVLLCRYPDHQGVPSDPQGEWSNPI